MPLPHEKSNDYTCHKSGSIMIRPTGNPDARQQTRQSAGLSDSDKPKRPTQQLIRLGHQVKASYEAQAAQM